MAISTTSSSTSTGGTASVDVASIVSQLMASENKPLITLKDKIASKTTLISDLGTLKSKVANFQTAIESLQDPAALSAAVASSSDESIVKIRNSTGAIQGRHDILVSQVAQPAQMTFDQFGSSTANAGLAAGDTFSITIGSRSYTYSPPIFVTMATTTIENLKNWVNALGDNLSASIVPTSGSNYALKIQGTQPGSDNAISYSHTSSGAAVNGLGSPAVAPTVVAAQNAAFTLDGVSYTRNTNTITDALSGVTINLIKADAVHQSISVDKGDDKAPEVMQGLVDAFNDLVTTAKKLSARAGPTSSVTTNGSLANMPSALNFLTQIKSMLSGDIHYTLSGSSETISMGELGFEMQYDGTAKFNVDTFNAVGNATAILASGIKIGYQTYVVRDPVTGAEISKNTTDVTLDSYLKSLLTITTSKNDAGIDTLLAGAFDEMIKSEKNNISDMNKKKIALQLQLDQKQRSYTSQYTALNELLFKLSNTSNSLTNALSGLTNGQNNK